MIDGLFGLSWRVILTPAIAGAAGIALGELRVWFQDIRARRRALRVALYELLDLRHQVRLKDLTPIRGHLEGYLVRRFGPQLEAELSSPGGRALVRNILEAIRKAEGARPLGTSYAAAADNLAPHSPLLAYRLRGRDDLLTLDGMIDRYF